MVFYYIFNDKLMSAILTGGIMASFGPFVYVGHAVVKSPVFRALLLNPVSRKKMTKDFDGIFFGNIFFWAMVITPLVYYYVFFPELKSGDFYGDSTTPIVWVSIITIPMGAWSSNLGVWGDMPVKILQSTFP